MELTALEIKQQQFEKSLRGYDTTEVNAFLNLVSREWEHMVGRIKELESKIDQLEDKLKHYERVEQALHETLQTAKDSAEQKLINAKKESQNIIEKAEMESESIVREANQQRQQIRQSILSLLDRREEIISGMKSYLEIAQDSLQNFSKDEAALFKIPKGDTAPGEDLDYTSVKKRAAGKKEEEERKKDAADQPAPPGTENLDDILDELD
ncbi:MAG: DivIVA domain-containing protein [Balneolaceae bacterium]